MNTHLYVFNPPAPVSSLMSSKICVFLLFLHTHIYLHPQSPYSFCKVHLIFLLCACVFEYLGLVNFSGDSTLEKPDVSLWSHWLPVIFHLFGISWKLFLWFIILLSEVVLFRQLYCWNPMNTASTDVYKCLLWLF